MQRNALVPLLLIPALLLASACGAGGGDDSLRPRDPSRDPSRDPLASGPAVGGSCGAVDGPGELLVVDWRAEVRGELEEMMKEYVGVIHHDCHAVRVLKACRVDGRYAFSPMTRTEQSLQLTSGDETKKTLPFFGHELATKLESDLQRGSSLDLAMVMVGSHATPRTSLRRAELSGDCSDATHFVPRATVGAFVMETGTRGRVRTVAEIMGATVHASSTSSVNLRVQDGSIDDCAKAKPDARRPPAQCGALVRLELRRLAD